MQNQQLLSVFIFAVSFSFLISCQPKMTDTEANPAAPGFQLGGSDEKAIAIADEVMEAMGGRKAWDDTQYLSWTFFGRRQHIWDKANQKAQIYSPGDNMNVLLNLADNTGTVTKNNIVVTNQDSIDLFLDQGKKASINDSYWLVMPFKLKDSGGTLKYLGKGQSEEQRPSDVLELTFENVGVTPHNKYHVYVDESSRLVTQWDYYANAIDSLPRFKSAWPNYKQYGDILLSGGVIGGNALSDISVEVPEDGLFEGI